MDYPKISEPLEPSGERGSSCGKAMSSSFGSSTDWSQNLVDLLFLLERIHATGTGFKSVTEAGDITTAQGKMLF